MLIIFLSCAWPSESFWDRERQLTDLQEVNGYKETDLKCGETYNLHAPQYCDADARWKSANSHHKTVQRIRTNILHSEMSSRKLI